MKGEYVLGEYRYEYNETTGKVDSFLVAGEKMINAISGVGGLDWVQIGMFFMLFAVLFLGGWKFISLLKSKVKSKSKSSNKKRRSGYRPRNKSYGYSSYRRGGSGRNHWR